MLAGAHPPRDGLADRSGTNHDIDITHIVLLGRFKRAAIFVITDMGQPLDCLAFDRLLMAMCAMAVEGVAPCQCFLPGAKR